MTTDVGTIYDTTSRVWNKGPCGDCGATGKLLVRGVCKEPCYGRRARAGTLHELPGGHTRASVVILRWCALRDAGYTRKEAARRIGITHGALESAIRRANRRLSG